MTRSGSPITTTITSTGLDELRAEMAIVRVIGAADAHRLPPLDLSQPSNDGDTFEFAWQRRFK